MFPAITNRQDFAAASGNCHPPLPAGSLFSIAWHGPGNARDCYMVIGPLISLAGNCLDSLLGSTGKQAPAAPAKGETFAQILSAQLKQSGTGHSKPAVPELPSS
jgi:hypothetical protein